MTSMNRVYLAGNLTRDPEVRFTSTGRAVASLSLAMSDRYKNKEGELVESTCYVDVEAWGKNAELCGEYLKMGSLILVEGRLKLDQWEGQGGEKRSKLKVHADRIQFLSASRKTEGGESMPTESQSSQMRTPASTAISSASAIDAELEGKFPF